MFSKRIRGYRGCQIPISNSVAGLRWRVCFILSDCANSQTTYYLRLSCCIYFLKYHYILTFCNTVRIRCSTQSNIFVPVSFHAVATKLSCSQSKPYQFILGVYIRFRLYHFECFIQIIRYLASCSRFRQESRFSNETVFPFISYLFYQYIPDVAPYYLGKDTSETDKTTDDSDIRMPTALFHLFSLVIHHIFIIR